MVNGLFRCDSRNLDDDCIATREIETCPHCNVNEVEVDDYGYFGCLPCFKKDKKAQTHIANMQEKEDFMFGYDD